jgi:HlyD family secretion protein
LKLGSPSRGWSARKVSLALAKQVLKNDLAQFEIDLASTQARIEIARRNCEASLVRSPLDGVVVQIATRPGERISSAGIAKVVDMNQLRVLADVSEDQVARLAPGGQQRSRCGLLLLFRYVSYSRSEPRNTANAYLALLGC